MKKQAMALGLRLANRFNPVTSDPSAPLKTISMFDSFGPMTSFSLDDGATWAPSVLAFLPDSPVGYWLELVVPFLPMLFIGGGALVFAGFRK